MRVEALTLSKYTEALVRKHIAERKLTDVQIAERFDFPIEVVTELRHGPRPSELFPGVYKSNVVRLPIRVPTDQTLTLYGQILEPHYAVRRVAVVFRIRKSLILSSDMSQEVRAARAAVLLLSGLEKARSGRGRPGNWEKDCNPLGFDKYTLRRAREDAARFKNDPSFQRRLKRCALHN